jgi:2-isopropylmalate synthase
MNKYSYPGNFMIKREWPDRIITKAPIWCSVDLRDGNQALPNPMTPAKKLKFFKMLTQIGFKEIEVAFPSSGKPDFEFTRKLIDENFIPDDVTIMGLTACREELIMKTMEAFRGAKQAIVHSYLATSKLHLEEVLNLTPAQAIKKAVKATGLIKSLAKGMKETKIRYQFSAEEFSDTDPEFALEICTAVWEAWGGEMIINLPATVERRPPDQYADMIEIFCSKFPYRDRTIISLHCHNDQGMAVAATEMGLRAGANRVEGCLFDGGERAGNVSLVTLAGNLHCRGIETGLDLSCLEKIRDQVEKLTGLPVFHRQPYAGNLVVTAFSGSHQDAIWKTLKKDRQNDEPWRVAYLHFDPNDFGRDYDNLININSQSGRGGVGWVLETKCGLTIPKDMLPLAGKPVKKYTEKKLGRISAKEVYRIFCETFIKLDGPIVLIDYRPVPIKGRPGMVNGKLEIKVNGKKKTSSAEGIGPIEAFVKALKKIGLGKFSVNNYHSDAIGKGEKAKAIAYVPLKIKGDGTVWGAAIHPNIEQAAILAIISGLNQSLTNKTI